MNPVTPSSGSTLDGAPSIDDNPSMRSEAAAFVGLLAAIAVSLASCTSDAPPLDPTAGPDASSSGCACTAMACASGADVRITTPVSFDSLASTQIDVCRLPNDCQSTPFLASPTLSVEGPNVLLFRWNGNSVNRAGDRYSVGIWRDGALLFFAEGSAAYVGKNVNTCTKSVDGRNVPCDPPGFDCYRATLDLTLASTIDGGVDAGVDSAIDSAADAEVDAALDAPTDVAEGGD